MQNFIRLIDRLADVLAIVAGAMVLVAVLIVTYMVIVRLGGASNYWEIEASIYLSIGAIFLASPYCLRTGGHVGVDMLPAIMGPRLRKGWRLTLKLIGLAICLYLAWVGAHLTLEAYVSGECGHSLRGPACAGRRRVPADRSLTGGGRRAAGGSIAVRDRHRALANPDRRTLRGYPFCVKVCGP